MGGRDFSLVMRLKAKHGQKDLLRDPKIDPPIQVENLRSGGA